MTARPAEAALEFKPAERRPWACRATMKGCHLCAEQRFEHAIDFILLRRRRLRGSDWQSRRGVEYRHHRTEPYQRKDWEQNMGHRSSCVVCREQINVVLAADVLFVEDPADGEECRFAGKELDVQAWHRECAWQEGRAVG